jgi:hypothetical protein
MHTRNAILSAGLLFPIPAAAQARVVVVPAVSFTSTYDDNIFTTQDAQGDGMMLVTPSLEGFYDSPRASLHGMYSFDMQRATGYSTLNTLEARRHALADVGFQAAPRLRLSLASRYDMTESPGELNIESAVLFGRRRAVRWQVTPALTYTIRPRTTFTAMYDGTREALAEHVGGAMHVARLGLAHQHSPRTLWRVNYLSRTFVNGADLKGSQGPVIGWTREMRRGTSLTLQGGPRFTTYGGIEPEIVASVVQRMKDVRVGIDYWQGESIILGVSGPVSVQSAATRATWYVRRNLELGSSVGVFRSTTLEQAGARVIHGEAVAAWSPGGPYTIAASYGADFQRGDIRSELLNDTQVFRHVFRVRVTFAPTISQSIRPSDPNDPRSPRRVPR